MGRRGRTRIEESAEEPAYIKGVAYPEDVYLNLVGRGDIYIKRNNAVYKLNIDKFLKEFGCLIKEETKEK